MFGSKERYNEFEKLIDKAIELGLLRKNNPDDADAIKSLGEGWTADETLAIAIYSALQHPIDLDRAVMCAVNHDGDSDSTGSVTGNIVGAYLGLVKADSKGKYFTKIEAYDTILEIAEDLAKIALANDFCDITDAKWYAKYLFCTYMQDNTVENSDEDNKKENEELKRLQKMYDNNEIDEDEFEELLEAMSEEWFRSITPGTIYELHEMEEMLGDDGYWDDEENN